MTEARSGQNVVFGTKPLQILVPYLKVLSPRDGVVMEPFGGSGSTLIACEIMKRKCRAIELEPLYTEVIIARWEHFTKQKAVRVREGADDKDATQGKPEGIPEGKRRKSAKTKDLAKNGQTQKVHT